MLSNLFKIDEEGYVMVKRLFALWMIVVLLFLITACTQSEDQGQQDATTTTQAQTSLTTKAEVTTTAKQETVTTATTEVENPFAERMTIT
jgi:cytoskeletal protein RodZ